MKGTIGEVEREANVGTEQRHYETKNIDFVDGYIAAVMEKQGMPELYSFERKHISRIQAISRKEP